MTGTGVIVSILAFALPFFGVTVEESQIAEFVKNAAEVIGFVLIVIGQLRRPDLKMGVIRKQ